MTESTDDVLTAELIALTRAEHRANRDELAARLATESPEGLSNRQALLRRNIAYAELSLQSSRDALLLVEAEQERRTGSTAGVPADAQSNGRVTV